MRKTFWYIVGGQLATISIPAVAQDSPAPAAPQTMEEGMDAADRVAALEAWPEARRTAYEEWPQDTRQYYWTLAPDRQEMFWRLDDADKVALSKMNAADRGAAWEAIEVRSSAERSQPEARPDKSAKNPEPEGR